MTTGVVRQRAWAGGLALGAICAATLVVSSTAPWARVVRLRADGFGDELALSTGGSAAVALLVLALWRHRGLAAFPLVAGLACFGSVAYTLVDSDNLVNRPTHHLAVHPAWGAWAALIGAGGLSLAGAALLAETITARVGGSSPRLALGFRLRKWQRRRFRRRVAAFAAARWPVVSVLLEETVMLLPTADVGLSRRLAAGARRPELIVLPRAVHVLRAHGQARPGTALVDIGANLGTTTLPALADHDFGRVLAVEPDPDNVRFLRASLALNRLDDRAHVAEAAASDTIRRSMFSKTGDGRTWSSGAGRLGAQEGSIEVDVVTVDSLLAREGIESVEVGLLWIDAQGREGHVIAGARDLLDRHVPIVTALRPRKLRRTGGSDLLLESVRDGYDTVVDLRRPSLAGDWAPSFAPLTLLRELLDEARTTDVLIFRRAHA